MTLYVETPAFAQFNPTPELVVPLHVMFVEDSIFERMQADSIRNTVEGVTVRVVSLLHLVALKCHAFQHGSEGGSPVQGF